MAMRNGHLNGSGQHDEGGGNVTSLDEARKRAAEKAKAEARAKRARAMGAGEVERGPRTLKDWIIGGTIILLALSFILSLLMPLFSKSGGGG